MEKNITILDGTSKAQLVKSIKMFESYVKCDTLKVTVLGDHTFTLVEFDGIVVTMWCGKIDNFIRRDFTTMRIVSRIQYNKLTYRLNGEKGKHI